MEAYHMTTRDRLLACYWVGPAPLENKTANLQRQRPGRTESFPTITTRSGKKKITRNKTLALKLTKRNDVRSWMMD